MMTHRSTALLLLDYQVALCEEGPHTRLPALAHAVRERDVLAKAAAVLGAARAAGVPVLHVRLAFDPTFRLRTNRSTRFDAYPKDGAMLAGSPEARIVEALAPRDDEPVIDKGAVDPFVGTPLREVLAAEGIDHIVIAGVATNLVVESCARHATDAGLQVTVLEDLCASFSPEAHAFAVDTTLPMFATVASSDQVLREWS